MKGSYAQASQYVTIPAAPVSDWSFPSLPGPTLDDAFFWGDLDGNSFYRTVDGCYEEVVHMPTTMQLSPFHSRPVL